MIYSVQADYGKGWETRVPFHSGTPQEFDTLERAVKILEHDADLSRWIWPLRVIDSDGNVYRIYEPEDDTRLPGCRWRKIQRTAYDLWEKAGRPHGDGRQFWHQAEAELPDSRGVRILRE